MCRPWLLGTGEMDLSMATRASVRLLTTWLGACASCLLLVGAVRAQDYETAVERGVQEFSAGNWEEACVNFELADELRPGPRPLRGLGMCLYEQKRYAESVDALERALSMEDAEYPLTEEMASSAQTLLQTARQYVVKLVVRVHPAEATLSLDGRPTTPGPVYVNSGTHELVATLDGRKDVRRVEVRLGEQLELDLHVDPAAPDAAFAADAGSGPQPAVGIAPIVAFAAGGAGLLTAGIFGAMSLSEYGRLEDDCGKACTDSEVSTLDTYTLVTDVGLGVGVLGTAVGLWLWQAASDDEYGSVVMPLLGPGQVGLTAKGSL